MAKSSRKREAERARAADDRYPHAASSTCSARRRADVAVSHEGLRDDKLDRCLGGSVRLVDHERVDQPLVALRDMGRGRAAFHAESIRSSRAGDGFAAHERAHGDARDATGLDRSTDLADGQDRPDREVGVARCKEDRVRGRERLEHAGRGAAASAPSYLTASTSSR